MDLSRIEPLLGASAPPGWRLARLYSTGRGQVVLEIVRNDASFALRFGVGDFPTAVSTPLGPVVVETTSEAALDAARTSLSGLKSWALPLAALFPHLLGPAPERIHRVLASRPPWATEVTSPIEIKGDLRLDEENIRAWLSPHVAVAKTLAEHELRRIDSSHDERTCALTFERNSVAVRVLFGSTHALSKAFVTLGDLAIAFEGEVSVPQAVLGSWLSAIAAIKRGPAGKLRIALHDGASRPAFQGGSTLHLQLNAECAQSCSFCPIRAEVPARDDGDAQLDELLVELQSARAAGADHVQLNGFDPLAFSRILELVAAISQRGFTMLTAMGPGRRFADVGFRDAFLSRAPPDTTIVLPLYGVTAAVHDSVTGLPGSHATVLAALDALRTVGDRVRLALSSVVTRGNVHELAALAEFAGERGLPLWSQPVYPLNPSPDDSFRRSAIRESEITRTLLEGLRGLSTSGRDTALLALDAVVRHPCVRFHAGLREDKRRVWELAGAFRKPSPDQTISTTTVPCEHAGACALSDHCPKQHYGAYVELFGTDEFVPVETIA